jgi:hypothetical protein
MDWGVWSWAKLGIEILFKPQAAGKTYVEGPAGLRVTDAGIFLADADVAWATMADGTLMTNEYFVENVLPRVRTVMEVLGHKDSPVKHGPHMNVEAIFWGALNKLKTKYPNSPVKIAQVMKRFRNRYFNKHGISFFRGYYKNEVYIYGRTYGKDVRTGYLGSGKMKETLDQYAPGWKEHSGGRIIEYPVPSPEKAFPVDPRIRAVLEYHEAHGRFPSTVGEAMAWRRNAPGKIRAERFGQNWQEASLIGTIRRIAGEEPIIQTTKTGKVIYQNPDTGIQVIHDIAGNYFRVRDPNIRGIEGYLDQYGNPIPANVPVVGPGRTTHPGVPRDLRQTLTHFMNADTKIWPDAFR